MLKGFFSDSKLCKISEENVRAYQQKRHAEKPAPAPRTINHEVKLLLRIMRACKAPLPKVEMLETSRTAVHILDAKEKKALWETAKANPDWFPAFCAAILTANGSFRPAELRRIKWQDVNPIDKTITVLKSKTKAGNRVVPLNDEACAAVGALHTRALALGTRAPDHYLFHRIWPKIDGTQPSAGWRTAWRSLRVKAGLPGFRYYDLRHQAVTEMLEAGIPEGVIREVVGHVDPEMTRWYSHPRLEAKRAAVAALSASKPAKQLPAPSDQPAEGQEDPVTSQSTSQLPVLEESEVGKPLNLWYARLDSNQRPLVPETNALSN